MTNYSLYVYHHLGLGDHIICNGLIRYLIKKYNTKITLVVKKSNFNNVKRMFSDNNAIDLFVVSNDEEIQNYINKTVALKVLKIGFDRCINSEFDKSFYDCAMVPFNERWDSWYIERNYKQEDNIMDELNIKDEYIFVHDESSTGKYNLNIRSDLRVIRPTRLFCEQSIFDWIKVIENAKEVHSINSSFTHLINSLQLTNPLYYHNIKASDGMGFSLIGNWNIVQY